MATQSVPGKKKPRPRCSPNLSRSAGQRRRKSKSHRPGALVSPPRPPRKKRLFMSRGGLEALVSATHSIQRRMLAGIAGQMVMTTRAVGALAEAIASIQRGLMKPRPSKQRCLIKPRPSNQHCSDGNNNTQEKCRLKDQLSLSQTKANKLREKSGALQMELKTTKEESRDSLRRQKVIHRERIKEHNSEFRAATAKKQVSANIPVL